MKYIIPNNRIHPELEYFDEAYHRYCSGAKFPQGCKDLRDEKIKLTLELTNAYSEKNIDINKEYERFCYKENSSIITSSRCNSLFQLDSVKQEFTFFNYCLIVFLLYTICFYLLKKWNKFNGSMLFAIAMLLTLIIVNNISSFLFLMIFSSVYKPYGGIISTLLPPIVSSYFFYGLFKDEFVPKKILIGVSVLFSILTHFVVAVFISEAINQKFFGKKDFWELPSNPEINAKIQKILDKK